jgi:hypothetical protein
MGTKCSMRRINIQLTGCFSLLLTQRRSKRRERNNIKIFLRGLSLNHMDLIQLARYRMQHRILQHRNEIWRVMKT